MSASMQSVASLSDASTYDMVDDISDFSSDDHDTVSLASTEQAEDDSPYDQIANVLDDMQSLPLSNSQMSTPALIVSGAVDETPRQSTVTFTPPPMPESDDLKPTKDNEHCKHKQEVPYHWLPVVIPALMVFILCIVSPSMNRRPHTPEGIRAVHAARQQELFDVVAQIHPHANITHLVPEPEWTERFFGNQLEYPQQVRWQPSGDDLLVSLPGRIGSTFPAPRRVTAQRGDELLTTNVTRIIDGVYSVSVPDPFGIITVHISCDQPRSMVTITHDFGRPILHAVRSLAERVSTDIQVFVDQAAVSAQRIEKHTKEFATALQTELRRDLLLSRERALSIAFDLRNLAQWRPQERDIAV